MSEFQLVICNTPNIEIARKIARELLNQRLCACVNILPKVESLYIWEDKLVEDSEATLLIKTTSSKYGLLEIKIKELHPYDIPEIIAFDIDNGSNSYLCWIKENLS